MGARLRPVRPAGEDAQLLSLAALRAPALGLLLLVLSLPLLAVAGLPLPRAVLGVALWPPAAVVAVSQLGPAGLACLSGLPYEYTPASKGSDPRVVRDPPESAVAERLRRFVSDSGAAATDVTVERVLVYLREPSARAEANARIRWIDGTQRRYVVQLGGTGFGRVSLVTPRLELTLCQNALGAWTVTYVSPTSAAPEGQLY